MASGASLAIAISQSGAGPVEKAMEGLAKTVGKLGSAATAPIRALTGLGGALGGIAQTAAGFALGGALTQLPGALLDMAQGAAADEQATMRLSQSITNLGGDFDSIMGKVNDAIGAGQKLAFSDDDVRDSFQFLAAATGDADEALRRQKAAMDLARGANIPLATATKMLGKLNEENIEVFKKLGITLGDNATEASALAAVQAKFGGQAEAFANSTAGQFEQAKIAMAEIQESIGSALLPVLAKVGGVLAENLPAIQEWVGAFAGGVANIVGPALESLAPLVQDVFGRIVEFATPIMAILPDIGTAISQAFQFFTTGSGDIEVFRGVLNRLLGEEGAQGVIHVFTNLTGFVQHDLIPAFQTAGQIVSKVLSGDLAGALSQVGGIVKAVAPQIASALVEWGRQFVAWVQLMWPPFRDELGRLWTIVLAYVADQAPKIADVLLRWAGEFTAWVVPMIPGFLVELGKFGLAVGLKLGEMALEFARLFFTQWLPAFVGWTVDVAPEVIAGMEQFKVKLGEWIVHEGVPFMFGLGLEIGKAIVRGIWEGQFKLRDWLTDNLKNLMNNALDAVKRSLGISSPSKVWAEEVGQPIAWGIAAGIVEGRPMVQTALVETINFGALGDDWIADARMVGQQVGEAWINGLTAKMSDAEDVVLTIPEKVDGWLASSSMTAAKAGEELGVVVGDLVPVTDDATESARKWAAVLGTEFPAAVAAAKEGPFRDLGDLVDDIRKKIEKAIEAWRDLQHRISGGGSAAPMPMPGSSGGGPGPGGSGGPGAGVPGGFPGGEVAAVSIYQTIHEGTKEAVTAGTMDALARARIVSGVL